VRGARGMAVTGAPHTDRTVNDVLDQILADPMVTTIGAAIGAAFIALWLAAAWWAYADATHRTGSVPTALLVAAWIIVSTPLLLPLSLPIYALVRPHESASERRTRRLAAELAGVLDEAAVRGCFSCGYDVDPAWHRCPSCTTWLARPCASCGSWSDRTLDVCPYCGGEERTEPAIETLAPAAAVKRDRRGRRRARPVGPGHNRVPRPAPPGNAPDGRPLAPLRVG
jgi:RNA polymerase subunit RPABC4/transcription elongation factor Spt4